jgi:hypothetical protein
MMKRLCVITRASKVASVSLRFILQEFRKELAGDSVLAKAIDEDQPWTVIAAIAQAEGYSDFAEALEAQMSGSSPAIDKKPGPMY